MSAAELTFWDPHGTTAYKQVVTSAADVETLAEDLLIRYQAAGDMLPGIELTGQDEDGSLSIAVAPFGWALVHSDADFNQHCTRAGDTPGDSIDIRWDQPTAIPRSWFVLKPTALVGVAQWLYDGSLATQLPWSDQCY